MRRVFIWSSVVLYFILQASIANAQDLSSIDLKSCFINQILEKAKCATVKMPLDHRGKVDGDIDVFVAVIPALSSQVLDDPLVVFSGGPGQATSDLGSMVGAAFKSIREHREIILIDQRGTGKSTPLRCEDTQETVYDAAKHIAAMRVCRANYDFAVEYFTMANVIADSHAILEALGYKQVNLWGVSWGTRSAVHYLRRYPDSVRTVIVDGVLPPDIGVFETSPISATRALNLLYEACRLDAACASAYGDIEHTINELIAKATDSAIIYIGADPVTGEQVTQAIGFMTLVQNIRAILYTPQQATMLPMALNKLNQGDGRAFMELTASGAMMSKSMYIGATLSLLCGEEVPRMTPERAKEIGANHITQDTYYQYWRTACKAWPSLPGEDDIHTALVSDVPMLILSGELDPITPPLMGEHLAKTFSNSRHLIVEGVGHNVSYQGCIPKLLGTFVKEADASVLEEGCLDKMKRPAFAVPLAAKKMGDGR